MASPRPLLCTDAAGVLRGPCGGCADCPAWQLWRCSEVRFKHEGPRRGGEGEGSTVCEACGCPAGQHRNLQEWLVKARRWVQCLVTKDGRWPAEVPPSFRLPAAAQDWEPAGAALHIVTNGQFDPSRDGRGSASGHAGGRLVSVVCPSIERYHVYHPLLYDCFRRQSHGDSELIVVDSGTTPSAFMVEKAQQDSRVLYRFFFREEHGPERDEDPLERVRREDDPGEVIEWKFVPWTDAEKAEVRWEGFAMSLGLKRNIACYLARGSAIVHFNAGDLYASGYLSRMQRELGLPCEGEVPVRAAALAEWHGLNLPKESFRRLDFRKKELVSEEKRERLQLGRGFTLAYTRPTWDKVPFQDDEEPEGRFMKTLQLLSHLRMVQPSRQDVLAAHSYDHASASGANAAASINISGEIKDLEEHSEAVSTPSPFADLMPAVHRLAALAHHKRGEEVARLLELEGAAYFCEKCDAAVALKSSLIEVHRVGDPEGGSCMVAQFARAGGAIAEGEKIFEDNKPLAPVPQLGSLNRLGGLGVPRLLGIPTQAPLCPNWKAGSSAMNGLQGQAPGLRSVLQPLAKASQELPWFPGWSRRAALCRRCGSSIGRRYEQKEALDLEAAIFWALDLKCLREREAPKAPPAVQDTRVKAKSAAKKSASAPVPAQEQRLQQKPSQERKAPAAKKPQQSQEAPRQQKAGPTPVQPKPAQPKVAPPRPVEEAPRIESKPSPPASAPVTEAPPASAPVIEARADRQVGVPAEALAAKAVAAKPPPNAPQPAKEPPAALTPAEKKAKDAAEKARAAVRSLSPDLQEQLANGLAAADKSKFDSALNSLRIDAETRRIILLELQVRPGMAASQLEQLVAKAFKTRTNMLRSLGIRVIRAALEEVLPEALREALRKAAASTSEGAEGGHATGAGREPRPSPASSSPEELPAARPPPPQPAAAAEAAGGGGGDMAFDFDELELLDPAPPPED